MSEEKVDNGRCLCGAITFRITGEPIYRVICFCENCRRTSGSAFHTAGIFLRKQYTLLTPSTDDPAAENLPNITVYADHVTQSGKPLYRRFCSVCGSKISAMTPWNTDIISVPAGILEDGGKDWKPNREQFVKDRTKWLPNLGDLAATMEGPVAPDDSSEK